MLVVIGAFYVNEGLIDKASTKSHRLAKLRTMESLVLELGELLANARTGQRGLLSTRDPRYLESHDLAGHQLPTVNSQLRVLADTDPDLLALVARLEGLRAESMTGPVQSKREYELMGSVSQTVQAFRGDINSRIAATQSQAHKDAELSRWVLAVLTASLLLMLVLMIRRHMQAARQLAGLRLTHDAEQQQLNYQLRERTVELAELSTHLQKSIEQEKSDLARDLHDELGGLLTAVKMDVSWLQGRASIGASEVLARLQTIAVGVDQAMNVKRRVVEQLRPALLDHFGLSTALQAHFDETCAKFGLNCRTEIATDLDNISGDMAIALFRVGQEALTNIIRHAQAKNVELSLRTDGDNYNLTIADDGRGLDSATLAATTSHGLAGMRHRIAALGGQLTIEKNAEHGTRVNVSIPRVRAA